jgi:hypothetical protein
MTATLFLMLKVKSSFQLVTRVRYLKHYVTEIPDEIRDKELEENILFLSRYSLFPPLPKFASENKENKESANEIELVPKSSTDADDSSSTQSTPAHTPSDPSAPLT